MATSMEEFCVLMKMPPEIWIEILKSDVLDGTDICNVSKVCTQLNEIASSNDLWKTKICQRWSKQIKCTAEEGWKELYKIRTQILRAVEECIRDVAEKNYNCDYVSSEHFEQFLKVMELHDQAWHFIMEDMFDILNSPRHSRLTDKFYTEKAVKYLQHHRLKSLWSAFFSAPQEEQHLEIDAMYVSWWMKTEHMVETSVKCELDSLADSVRDVLRCMSKGTFLHPACTKDNSITGITQSLWTANQNMQVLKAMNIVLYEDLQLLGKETDFYTKKNFFTAQVAVSKKGIPVMLGIIYHAVALRLGVVCQPTRFPTQFLLAFSRTTQSGRADMFYIDALNKGRMLTADQCLHTMMDGCPYNESYFQILSPYSVFQRMAHKLVLLFSANTGEEENTPAFHDAVSLFLAISLHNNQMIAIYTNLCLHLGINLQEVIRILQEVDIEPIGGINLLRQCEMQLELGRRRQHKKTVVKVRSSHPQVMFSVGMVMKHKAFNYKCVIFGWDPECKASEEWIKQMGVNLLPQRHKQPFYNVLVEDDSVRYAAQENLTYTQEVREIKHDMVGRYFQEFTGLYYVPNSSMHTEYPDDAEVTRTLVEHFFSEQELFLLE